VHIVAEGLPAGVPLVVDPVMVATRGEQLLDADAVRALAEEIFPRATVVTPNVAEVAVLAGTGPITTLQEMREAAGQILDLGPISVGVKGGDLPSGAATDLYLDRSGELVLSREALPLFGARVGVRLLCSTRGPARQRIAGEGSGRRSEEGHGWRHWQGVPRFMWEAIRGLDRRITRT